MAEAFNTFGSVFVDGVAVKLHEKFKPLPKIKLPANFEMGNPTEVLFMEYDFSLEESVIAWSNERKKHIEQQKERERLLLEQQRKEHELLKQQREEQLKQKALEEQTESVSTCDENSIDNELKTVEEFRDNNSPAEQEKNESSRPSNHDSQTPKISQSTETVPVSSPSMQVSYNNLSNYSEKLSQTGLPQSMGCQEMINSNQQISQPNPFPSAAHKLQTFVPTSQPSVPQTVFTKYQPVFYSVGQDILMPLPAAKPKVPSEKSSTGPSSFNPADFENEVDPFDNLELKTLDDLKELDKVLKNVQVGERSQNAESPVPKISGNVQVGTQFNNSLNTVPSVPPGISPGNFNQPINGYTQPGYNQQVKNIQYSNMDYKNNGSIAGNSNIATPANMQPVNINQTSGAVSYKAYNSSNSPQSSLSVDQQSISTQPWNSPPSSSQQLRTDTPQNSSHLYRGTTYGHTNMNNLSINSLANSSQYSLAGNNSSINPNSNTWTSPQNQILNNSQQLPQQQQQPPPNQYQIWREFLQKNSPTPALNNSSQFSNNSNYRMPNAQILGQVNGYIGYLQQDPGNKDSGSRSQGHSRSNTPPPGMGKLRSARSTPDLAALVNNSDNETLPYQSRSPPVPRRMKSPPPSASFCDSYTKGTNSKSTTLTGSNNMMSEVDPYRTMSGEAKRFVDNLTNMGFRRITVAKAVQRIGMDEKNVLDFLCGITRLKEKGLTEQQAEDILLLPEKDQKKAQDFQMLCKRFQEFGFKEDKIREGLFKCNLDEEKTLDWLTTN